jgi:hypothetical protein
MLHIRLILISFFSGPNYIRPNQSYLYTEERQQKQIQNFLNNWQHILLMDIWLQYLI